MIEPSLAHLSAIIMQGLLASGHYTGSKDPDGDDWPHTLKVETVGNKKEPAALVDAVYLAKKLLKEIEAESK